RYPRAGRPERRGHGDGARPAAQAARGHSRGRRASDGPPAARSRRVPARPARADRAHQAAAMDGDALRSALGLRAAAPAQRALACPTRKRTVWSLAEARETLERLLGQSPDWTRLDEYLISYVVEPSLAPTVFASSFASTLELVREGLMEVHQQGAFAPLYVRKRQSTANGGVAEPGGVAASGEGQG